MDQKTAREPTAFVRFWNDILAPKFIAYRHVLVDGLSLHSDAIFPRLDVNPGDRILDVGCGFGDTAIMLAERVGPEGAVVGVDCTDAFLDIARKDAEAAGAGNVTFRAADVEIDTFDGDFDMVFSRFGTMFFTNPVPALRNMRTALKPGGRMTMIVWRRRDDNPWLQAAKEVALRHLPAPGDDAQTCGPGPFSMADEATTRAQLEAAGFADVAFERVDAKVSTGKDPKDAVAFHIALGPAGEIYREAGELAKQRHDALAADLEAMFARYQTADGIMMDSSSWVVSARNPG